MKPKIQEIIVVEGKHDTENLKRYFDCQTIETGGTSLDQAVLDQIAYFQQHQGVIIMTDPDTPGNQIRHQINTYVSGCKNAFVMKRDARTSKKVGIEHASFPILQQALQHLVTYCEKTSTITMQDLYELGLVGQKDSAEKRRLVSDQLYLGECNGKTFLHRLQYLNMTMEQLRKMIET